MWKKCLIIVILFYLFAQLQNSFFAHYNFFGAVPNLVFALFFTSVFFEKKYFCVILLSIIAGLFLDIFSYMQLGPSIVLLTGIGVVLKKVQQLLQNRQDNYPFTYFLPLFVLFFAIYLVLLSLSFDLRIITSIIYSAVFAVLMFYIFKKFRVYDKQV